MPAYPYLAREARRRINEGWSLAPGFGTHLVPPPTGAKSD